MALRPDKGACPVSTHPALEIQHPLVCQMAFYAVSESPSHVQTDQTSPSKNY